MLLQVYEVAGGNPLALKLLVGQMHVLALSRVVDDLREARGQKVEELYRYIYWRSWNLQVPRSTVIRPGFFSRATSSRIRRRSHPNGLYCRAGTG